MKRDQALAAGVGTELSGSHFNNANLSRQQILQEQHGVIHIHNDKPNQPTVIISEEDAVNIQPSGQVQQQQPGSTPLDADEVGRLPAPTAPMLSTLRPSKYAATQQGLIQNHMLAHAQLQAKKSEFHAPHAALTEASEQQRVTSGGVYTGHHHQQHAHKPGHEASYEIERIR